MKFRTRWDVSLALRHFWKKVQESPDDSLVRMDWAIDPNDDDMGVGHDAAEVAAIYSEVIDKIPVGVTKVLDLGCGDGGFYRALKAARPGVAYYGVDLILENIEDAQKATGSITVAAAQPGDTITINGVTLTAGAAQNPGGLDFDCSTTQATGSLTCASVQGGDTVSVHFPPKTLTAGSSQTDGGLDFNATGDDVATATSLAAAINAPNNGFSNIMVADNAGGTSPTVSLTAVPLGEAGNQTGVRSSSLTRLPWISLEGGAGSDVATASSLVAAINDPSNGLDGTVRASNNNGTSPVVTLRASSMGVAGDSITLASSSSRLAVSGATLTGGVDPGVFETGNLWEFLSEATVDWDFIVSIGGALTYTSSKDAETLFDLIDSKSPKGFFILADQAQASPIFLSDRMVKALDTSESVSESYYEGPRDFLDASLVKNLVPFYIHRDSTTGESPKPPKRACAITTGLYNRVLGRAVGKFEAQQGREIPSEFKGIVAASGRITGAATETLDPQWVAHVRVRPKGKGA